MLRSALILALGFGSICADKQCYGTGDPHYSSFDDLNYDFQGDCDYVMVDDCRVSSSGFTLQVRNRKWLSGSPDGQPTVTSGIAIRFGTGGPILDIGEDLSPSNDRWSTDNGGTWSNVAPNFYTSNPHTAPIGFSATLETSQNHRVISIPSLGLLISWKSQWRQVYVTMLTGSPLEGNTCGLCGDSDSGSLANEVDAVQNNAAIDPAQYWLTPNANNGLTNIFENDNVEGDSCYIPMPNSPPPTDDPDECIEHSVQECEFRQVRGRREIIGDLDCCFDIETPTRRWRRQPDGPPCCEEPSTTEGTNGTDETTTASEVRQRRQASAGTCTCDNPELFADAENFCADLLPDGPYKDCPLYNAGSETPYDNCLCDYCFDRPSAVGTFIAFQEKCVATNTGPPISFPPIPEDCIPRVDVLDDTRTVELCGQAYLDSVEDGTKNDNIPDFTSDATMCGKAKIEIKYGDLLRRSIANGIFGGSTTGDRDCTAWCLFSEENGGNHHFRWDHRQNQQCWRYKRSDDCSDSEGAEKDFAQARAADLCEA